MQPDHITATIGVCALIGACALLVGGASLAMGQAESIDSDGDGMDSFTELKTVIPSLTEAEFMALDADADGLLSVDELTAAKEAGMIPAG